MDLKALIRDVPDFPQPGVVFKDLTPMLASANGLHEAIEQLAAGFGEHNVDLVVGPESRGFIFGAAVAQRLRAGFVPVRKAGKLPWKTASVDYDLEYGKDTLEMHVDAIAPGQKVLLIDDVLATGGTAGAVCRLIRESGGDVIGAGFVIELAFLGGRKWLDQVPVHSLVKY